MVGIVQEQHPDRTRLFMQWKEMDWPILVDPLNLLGLEVVPVTLLIDEHGIVRFRGELEHLDDFLTTSYEDPSPAPTEAVRPPNLDTLREAPPTPDSLRRYAEALVLWGGPDGLDPAIEAFQRALRLDPEHGPTHFRLGVAHRLRYDGANRQTKDFHQAVSHWGTALALEPNQYIWRRRIQQYGPRLMKPYPFYDWVESARKEILQRGEEPVALPVEPQGAEIAQPAKAFEAASEGASPDPEGRIRRDERGFVLLEQTAVPSLLEAGETARVHLVFRPRSEIRAHWNNEAEDLHLWLDPPSGWQVDQRSLRVPNPPELVSDEDRRLEVEVRSPKDFQGVAKVPGYALYYVCEDVKGTCLYRRQDFSIELRSNISSD